MKILFIQHGDFDKAFERMTHGGQENYRDQFHSVRYVANLAPEHEVTVLCGGDRIYDQQCQPGLRAIGMAKAQLWKRKALLKQLEPLDADRVICRLPNLHALRWAIGREIPTLPVLADILVARDWLSKIKHWRLKCAFMHRRVPCVANHSLSASQALLKLGVPAKRIVPWELVMIDAHPESKAHPGTAETLSLFYAGAISENKGIGDCIEAVRQCADAGVHVTLNLAGPGELQRWQQQARSLGIDAQIHWLGSIPAEDVLRHMRAHDAVVVPSRHSYAEGLPNTIFEALASRSPLIASDHPAFAQRLMPDVDALRFTASDPQSLARQIIRLARDPQLYRQLSERSPQALRSLYVGLEWTQLIQCFIDDPDNTTGWVQAQNLATVHKRLDLA